MRFYNIATKREAQKIKDMLLSDDDEMLELALTLLDRAPWVIETVRTQRWYRKEMVKNIVRSITEREQFLEDGD